MGLLTVEYYFIYPYGSAAHINFNPIVQGKATCTCKVSNRQNILVNKEKELSRHTSFM